MFPSAIEDAAGDADRQTPAERPDAREPHLALAPDRPEVDELRRAGSVLADLAASLDAASVSDDDLMALARDAEAARRLLDSISLTALGELAARSTTQLRAGLKTPKWLASEALAHPAQARRDVTLATRLRQLPNVSAAMADGRIGIHHARVIANAANPRIAHLMDDATDDLVADLARTTFRRWETNVVRLAHLLDEDGTEPGEHPDPPPSTARHHRTADGLDIHWHVTGADARRVEGILDAQTDQQFAAAQREANVAPEDLPVPPRSQLEARALLRLLLTGHAADRATVSGPTTDATVVLRPEHAGRATSPDGVDVDPRTTAELLCDAVCTPVEVGDDDVPLRHGRSRRLASPAQRRALALRDGGCTFPGCDAPISWTRAHHSPHWHPDGRTDLDALCSECDEHHGLAHTKGWDVEVAPDGWTIWTTPTGRRFYGQRHERRRTDRPPP